MVTEGTNPEITGTGTAAEIKISIRNGKIKESTATYNNRDNYQKSEFESRKKTNMKTSQTANLPVTSTAKKR